MQSIQLESSGFVLDGVIALDSLTIEHPTLSSAVSLSLVNVNSVYIYENPLLTSVSFPALKSFSGTSNLYLSIVGNPTLTSINLSALVSSAGTVVLRDNPALTSLQLNKLAFVAYYLSLVGNSSLVTLSLPVLVSLSSVGSLGLLASNCTSLANVTFPKYLPINGRRQDFKNCALTEVSVDHILSRCVANANYVSGIVDLSGGMNAVPGTQGQLDKVTLIARGCTVLTN